MSRRAAARRAPAPAAAPRDLGPKLRRAPQPDPAAVPAAEPGEFERRARDWERRFRQTDVHLRILERERQKFSAVVNHADAGFLAFDASLRLVWANNLFMERYGHEGLAEPALGSECRAVLCGQSDRCAACPAHEMFTGGSVAHAEINLTVGGRDRHIYATAMPIRTPSGEIEEALVMLQDVSGLEILRRSQEALRASEERFRSIFESASAGMAAVSPDGAILQVNPAFCRFLDRGEPDLIGRNLKQIAHADDQSAAGRLLAEAAGGKRAPTLVEMRFLRSGGETAWGLAGATWLRDTSGRPAYALVLVQDVDERKQTEEALRKSEEQLRQSQKMEAIGRLAGGVAHDFNNLLTVITGRCALLLRRLEGDAPKRHEIEVIRDTADRAAALTRQLLAFSRKQVLLPQVVDLNGILANMDSMLRRLIGEDVRLVNALHPSLGPTRVDPSQMEQIIMNLAVNARDAMPGGGQLTIGTDNVTLASDSFAEVQAVPGPYVLLIVSDTGTGMDEPTRVRIFEPFFTTKGPGQGTGLGLSTVYGIVKQSGGYIFVRSEPGQGATFSIYLPCVEAASDRPRAALLEDKELRGTGTILLVEDESVLMNLAREILEQAGFTVIAASGSAEALQLSEEHRGAIDLLLTDVVMPGQGGRDLATALAAVRPTMRILYMSGYSDDAVSLGGMLGPGTSFLQKPFSPQDLARKVLELLQRRPA